MYITFTQNIYIGIYHCGYHHLYHLYIGLGCNVLSLRLSVGSALDTLGSNSHINRSRESLRYGTYLLIQFTRIRSLLIGNLSSIILCLSANLNIFIICSHCNICFAILFVRCTGFLFNLLSY